jgi:DNA mismatch endonuclease, patch repair protein
MSPTEFVRGSTAGKLPVSSATRHTMQANRGRDTGPERAVRSVLHGRGLRFRVCAPLPFDRRRRADITFTRVGLFVFIDGCYWHGCPEHFVMPKTNSQFWRDKIERNRHRDEDTSRRLVSMGFTVLRFWEHKAPKEIAEQVFQTYQTLRESQSRGETLRSSSAR